MSDGISLFPVWRQAVDDFISGGFTWGKIVEREWFHQHLELEPPREPATFRDFEAFRLDFIAAFVPFRQLLLEKHLMELRPVGRGRYEVIHPHEQVDEARDVLNRTMRKALERASRSIEYVQTERLTDDQRRHRTDMQGKLSMLEGMVRRHRLPRS
jgi:hypothetical protein